MRHTPIFRPRFRPRPDPRADKLREALLVLGAVAAEDADHAKTRNGKGFSKSDSMKGHALSKVSLSSALQDHALSSAVLAMAARYRRQASRIAQGRLI
ncbi:hypothetical protein J2X71_000239 [Rhizobium sp. 1399]|nr:hypothetical protein [Rhizobium sp. 1399]